MYRLLFASAAIVSYVGAQQNMNDQYIVIKEDFVPVYGETQEFPKETRKTHR